MYTTHTFITEVFTHVQLLLMTIIQWINGLYSASLLLLDLFLVSMMHNNAKAMPTNNTNYSNISILKHSNEELAWAIDKRFQVISNYDVKYLKQLWH